MSSFRAKSFLMAYQAFTASKRLESKVGILLSGTVCVTIPIQYQHFMGPQLDENEIER
jgi:hypothetical protein